MSTFQAAIDYTLPDEGGLVNNPNDPGGKTNFGISQRFYKDGDVADLTREKACAWYQRIFWKPVMEAINSQRICSKLFDHQINCGVGTANKIIQQAIHLKADGIIGPGTIRALNFNPEDLILESFVVGLKAHYKELEAINPKLLVFDRGWMARIARLPPKNLLTA